MGGSSPQHTCTLPLLELPPAALGFLKPLLFLLSEHRLYSDFSKLEENIKDLTVRVPWRFFFFYLSYFFLSFLNLDDTAKKRPSKNV